MFHCCTCSHVTSFPPAALPALFGTIRLSDSLYLFCLSPFLSCPAYSLFMKAVTGSPRLPRILKCQTCHGLRPRGNKYQLAINADIHFDFHLVNNVVFPIFLLTRLIPFSTWLTACLLAVLRLKKVVTHFPPKTRYPMDGHPFGTGFTPVRIHDLAWPH